MFFLVRDVQVREIYFDLNGRARSRCGRLGRRSAPIAEPYLSDTINVVPLTEPERTQHPSPDRELVDQPIQLRPLTSLKWPYVPEDSAFPDPLKRDDPKPLQLRHYEAMGKFILIYFPYRAQMGVLAPVS